MGRQEQKQARDMSQDSYNTQKAWSADDRNIRAEGRAKLMPGIDSMVNDPGYSQNYQDRLSKYTADDGYSPQEQSAISQETTGATNTIFGKARDAAQLRQARTGNSAGFAGMMGEMTRDEAKQQSSNTNRNMIAFADEKRRRGGQNLQAIQGSEDERQRRKEGGLQLMSNLYGVDTGAFTAGRGGTNAPLSNYTDLANQKGAGDKLQNVAMKWLSPMGG